MNELPNNKQQETFLKIAAFAVEGKNYGTEIKDPSANKESNAADSPILDSSVNHIQSNKPSDDGMFTAKKNFLEKIQKEAGQSKTFSALGETIKTFQESIKNLDGSVSSTTKLTIINEFYNNLTTQLTLAFASHFPIPSLIKCRETSQYL